MGRFSCFVPGCDTGYSSRKIKNKISGERLKCSLFMAPKDPDLLDKWRRAIPRNDKDLTHSEVVCEYHFKEDDIEKYYVTRMPDGTEHKLKRGKPLLKSGVIPSIFPNLPKYLSKITKKRKAPKERLGCPTKRAEKMKPLRRLIDEDQNIDHQVNEAISVSNFFDLILNNITTVAAPSESWIAFVVLNENAMWTLFENKFGPTIISKRVIIMKNLVVKVLLQEKEVTIQGIESPKSLEDVEAILSRVESLLHCKNRSATCVGYVFPRELWQTGRQRVMCCACRNDQKVNPTEIEKRL